MRVQIRGGRSSWLGYLLSLYSNEYFMAGMIAVILLLMVVVVVLNQALTWAEARALRWRTPVDVGGDPRVPS